MLNLIGLAYRARLISTGEDQTIKSIRSKEARLVFLANNAGPNTTKKIKEKCEFYKCPINTDFSSDQLSNAIGAQNRMVLAINDPGFAKKMKERM